MDFSVKSSETLQAGEDRSFILWSLDENKKEGDEDGSGKFEKLNVGIYIWILNWKSV